MAKLVLNGSTSGSVTLESPAVSGTTTLTLPTTSGTVITTGSTFGGTGPAFSAYLSANQTVSANTFVKIAFNTEEFDTNSNFDSTTNYRFTPTVAGYYQFNLSFFGSGSAIAFGNIYKNGSNVLSGSRADATTNISYGSMASYIIYCNGSTDYVEFYGYVSTGVFVGTNAGGACKVSACMVRSA